MADNKPNMAVDELKKHIEKLEKQIEKLQKERLDYIPPRLSIKNLLPNLVSTKYSWLG